MLLLNRFLLLFLLPLLLQLMSTNPSLRTITDPPTELGEPLPSSTPFALSVMIPTWQDNLAYEAGDADLLSRLQTGYPRFVFPPQVVELYDRLVKMHEGAESGMAFIARSYAQRCIAFLREHDHNESSLIELVMGRMPVFLVLFRQEAFKTAMSYIQYFGAVFSARAAEYCLCVLDNKSEEAEALLSQVPEDLVCTAKMTIRKRIASLVGHGVSMDDVYLYPCGMAAISDAHRLFTRIRPDGDQIKSVCFGFPYMDTLNVLRKGSPAGCHFYPGGSEKDIEDLASLLEGEKILSLFCEVPSNPLLKTPDLKRLRSLATKYDFMIAIDETIGNYCNVDVLPYADIIMTSLTKLFSGKCNAMGGCLILNPRGKHYRALQQHLSTSFEELLYGPDAIVLEQNSRDFCERSMKVNTNAELLCDYLIKHPKVSDVYYPKYICRDLYDCVRRSDRNSGYGGLLTIMLPNADQAAVFHDRLRCAKGPSLGTNFTLASPFCILARIDWAEEYGVSHHLVRVSVGLEDPQHLIRLFEEALAYV
ncbi:pyridoxal phosphate-dependent transferase [Dichotomocladium elegans]|nr:pyridoxal phosphate-dependent transferase [Dichotomocladium elegans]